MKKMMFLSLASLLLAVLFTTGASAADFDLPADLLEAVEAAAAEEAVFAEEAITLQTDDAGEDTAVTGSCGDNLTYRLENGVLTISGTGAMNAKKPWNTTELKETITAVVVEEGVTTLYADAFIACKNLSSVTLPSTLTKIGINAFSSCTALTEVTIRSAISSVGSGAFSGCTGILSVSIEDNSGLVLGDGVFSDCTSLSSVTLGNGTVEIGDTAFEGCKKLTNIYIPDSVTVLGTYAFQDCTALADVRLPQHLTKVPEGCFDDCSSLTSIVIPDSVTVVGKWAFSDCDALSVVSIGNGVSTIGFAAFARCTSLSNVILPYSIKTLGTGVFSCAGVTTVRFRGNAPTIGANQFEKLNLTVYYPDDAAGWTNDIMKEYNAESVRWQSYTVCPDGHTVEPGKDVVVDATLFAPGEIIHTCRVCGKTFVDPIPVRTEPNDADIAAHDINGDEKADAADLPALMKLIADAMGESTEKGDLNSDGKVDILDVIRLVRFLAAFA